MDQDAYHKTYDAVNDRPCHYEKAILAAQCTCQNAERFYLAERVGVLCRSDSGHHRCKAFLLQLRNHLRFTLKLTGDSSVLPHAKAMRLQAGGMLGLQTALQPERPAVIPVENIDSVLQQAMDTFTTFDQFPYQEIIKQVASY